MTPPPAEARVVHLFDSFAHGEGAERAAAVINGWKGAVRHSIVAADGAYTASALLNAGLKLGYPTDFPALGATMSPGLLLRLARRLATYDLILTYGYGAIGGALAHSLFGARAGLASLVHHEFGALGEGARALKPAMTRRLALARSSAIVVGDAAGAACAQHAWQQPAARIHLIPPGVAAAVLNRQARKSAIPRLVKRAGELWIGHVASGEDIATPRALLDGLEHLNPEWHLVLIGEGMQPLRELAIARELAHRVHFVGAVPDVARAMAAFDMFAAGPHAGGTRVIAAMAAGLPVLGVRGTGTENVVSAENAADLAADTAALGDVAGWWADDPQRRARIGAANREVAQAKHDLGRMVSGQLALYDGLLSAQRSP